MGNELRRYSVEEDDSFATHRFLHAGRMVSIKTEVGSRIDTALRDGHFYEHRMLGHVTRVARAGAFLDVGANCGHHSVYFGLFCPSTRVYAFEPLDVNAALVKDNIAANHLDDKVVLIPTGASSSISSFEMRTNAVRFQSRVRGICATIDDIIREPVSLIKIDVEGMEAEVLSGARRIVETYLPSIFFEAHDDKHRDAVADVVASLGYQLSGNVFNASPTYELVPPSR